MRERRKEQWARGKQSWSCCRALPPPSPRPREAQNAGASPWFCPCSVVLFGVRVAVSVYKSDDTEVKERKQRNNACMQKQKGGMKIRVCLHRPSL